ncbi:MAG: hypothetical protein RIT43_97 [Bacteroidota bacterium]|jgi:acyl-CoA thioester hydrolase
MKVNFTHEITLRVRYSETDQMGYCYYGRYADYFEVGRVETMRKLGISYKKLEDEGIMLPVTELSIQYHRPVYYDNELAIRTTITELSGARITFEYAITHEGKTTTTGKTTLVFVNSQGMKPIAVPEKISELLRPHSKEI